MKNAILGLFDNKEDAEDAISDLQEAGYTAKDISIIVSDKQEGEQIRKDIGAEVGTGAATGITAVAAAATASGAMTGALAGGLIGALMALGLPRETAETYERRIKEGAILLAVPAQEGKESEVEQILSDNAASDITQIPQDKYFSEQRGKRMTEDNKNRRHHARFAHH